MDEPRLVGESGGGGVPARSSRAEIERVVGALKDATRREILLSFHADAGPRTVDQVAAAAGVHRTVAYGHLEQLVSQGFLAVGRRRGRLGKPAKLYRLAGGPITLSHPARRFAELAGLLAGALGRAGPRAVAEAAAVGRERGRELARGAVGMPAALAALAPLGAVYHVEEGRIIAGNCVFREACPSAPAVVCGMQAAILAGALEGAGVECRVTPRGPTDDGRGCVYEVEAVAGG